MVLSVSPRALQHRRSAIRVVDSSWGESALLLRRHRTGPVDPLHDVGINSEVSVKKITVNRPIGFTRLSDRRPKIDSWYVREDGLAVCHVMPSYYVAVFFVHFETQLLTVATTEGKWAPCEVELVVT